MTKFKPYSALFAASAGLIIVGIGIYFIFIRPVLLPEDLRYIHATPFALQEFIPNLAVWLQKVFWVMGGYIFTTGLLTVFVSLTSFRSRLPGAFAIIALAGMSSIGFMTVVNFMIDSDFKWVLLTFTIPWIVALVFYQFRK